MEKVNPKIKRAVIGELKKYKKKLVKTDLVTKCGYCVEGLILKAFGYKPKKPTSGPYVGVEKVMCKGESEEYGTIRSDTFYRLGIPDSLRFNGESYKLWRLNDCWNFTPGQFIKLIEEQW